MVSTATAAQTLDPDAFNQLVLERGLTTWEAGGYRYAGYRGANGWELFRVWSGNWEEVPVTIAALSNPAAGTGYYGSVGPAAGKRWLLLGANCIITTDANAANRYPYAQFFRNGASTDLMIVGPTPITASLAAQNFSFVPGATAGGAVGAGLSLTVGMGEHEIPGGGVVRFGVLNVQAGDDLAVGYYAYKEVSV